jgi:hypothetical protein
VPFSVTLTQSRYKALTTQSDLPPGHLPDRGVTNP